MSKLFEVPSGTRVRMTSKLIRWREQGADLKVGEGVTWEGTTTGCYEEFQGERRRLVIAHTIPLWRGTGIWQTDCECEVVD
jgi:hypothetical protein